MKKVVLILVFLVFTYFLCFEIKSCFFSDSSYKIILKGSKIVRLQVGESYEDEGFKAVDSSGKNVDYMVRKKSNVDFSKVGSYEISYGIKSNGSNILVKRYVIVSAKPYYKDSYEKLDNTVRGWWSDNKKDNTRPAGGADINELKKYSAYFMGPNEKVIYLTFDEGGNDTYVKEIVDVLNKNDVKGTFFLCKKYMEMNADLIRDMVNNGHSIGNHTANHYSMPTLATKNKFNKYLSEIESVEEAYKKITGKEMDRIYRDPRGEWSFRDLQIMKDMGYRSYFYSADYMDFGSDVSKEYALNELMKRYHNGAIYLMHPKNKGNYLALESFIKEIKELGYRFDLVKNIQ